MASAFWRGQTIYIKSKDATGQWRQEPSSVRNVTEGRKFAAELERKAERQRRGLENLDPNPGTWTLARLLEWWLETYSSKSPSHPKNECGMKLWPKAMHRKVRFHDLRHTTASLLMMAGASVAAVQRILRHSDPKITTEVYGHLEQTSCAAR